MIKEGLLVVLTLLAGVILGASITLAVFYADQVQQMKDLEVENSALKVQIKTMQTEHDEVLNKVKESEESKDAEIVKIEEELHNMKHGALPLHKQMLEQSVLQIEATEAKVAEIEAKNEQLRSELLVTKAGLACFVGAIKNVRKSIEEGDRATGRMITSVVQSKKKVAKMSESLKQLK